MDEPTARAFCAARLDDQAMDRLYRLAALLVDENARQNLVSASSLDHVWERHFADSVQLLDHVPRETPPWLDLGSGAGFPGLPVAIARPGMEVVLIESRRKRVEWLERVIADLGLTHCRVIGARLELVPTLPAGTICARAFAPFDKLLRLSARFSTPATTWLLPKGRSAAKELAAESESIRAMFHVEQSATDPEAGILVGTGVPYIS
ncbi:MAG: 16S rRNA (guanine(527)-N(7))-methyltransferase RsmG [Croceibacterium sp.]